MTRKERQSHFSISGFLVAVVLGMMLIALLVMPITKATSTLKSEWEQAGHWLGGAPLELARKWGDDLDLTRMLTEQWGVERTPKNQLESKALEIVFDRIEVAGAVSYLLALRIAVAVKVASMLWPACIISLVCGFLSRQSRKNRYCFTSPFRMNSRLWLFRLGGLGVMMAMVSPVALPGFVVPLMLSILALMSGSLIQGLQKEI